jgi:hypothetical protein
MVNREKRLVQEGKKEDNRKPASQKPANAALDLGRSHVEPADLLVKLLQVPVLEEDLVREKK